jgi:hypothetical protein
MPIHIATDQNEAGRKASITLALQQLGTDQAEPEHSGPSNSASNRALTASEPKVLVTINMPSTSE